MYLPTSLDFNGHHDIQKPTTLRGYKFLWYYPIQTDTGIIFRGAYGKVYHERASCYK